MRRSLLLAAASKAERRPPVEYAARYAPVFVPLGLGIWLAHHGFHLAIGGLIIVPILQTFLLDHRLARLGMEPQWELGLLLPPESLFPLQDLAIAGGFAGSMLALAHRGLTAPEEPLASLKQILPWAIILVGLTVAALAVFNLPMEMHGAFGG